MDYRSDAVVTSFVEETEERLADIETGLLLVEQNGSVVNEDLIHSIFRDAHSIKAGANLLRFTNIESLSHKMENIFEMIRKGELTPDADIITVLLTCLDKLKELVANIENCDSEKIDFQLYQLAKVLERQK